MFFFKGAGHAAENSVRTDEDGEEKNSMENLRFIIEKFVEDLVGNVDNTPIDRLYNHPACEIFIQIIIILFNSSYLILTFRCTYFLQF